MGDLLGPEPVLLPGDVDAEAELLAGENPAIVAAAHPSASVAWAALAEEALADDKAVTAYAYARTGYHRGLDQLRRNGWKGFGPVPFSHEPNRGFLRCVAALARAADAIGETDEFQRCLDLLDDCDPRGPRRTRAGLAQLSAWQSLGAVRAARSGPWRAPVRARRSTARASSSTRAESAAAGQMRGGHVLAGHQRPHVQVVHLGDAVDGASAARSSSTSMWLGDDSDRMRSAARASEIARGSTQSATSTATTTSAYGQCVVTVTMPAISTPMLPTVSATTSM